MFVTVAICTWNRAELLDKTLAAMRELVVPSDIKWELVIVNNNCTDNTDDVIERHRAFLPIRRLFEPKQGHSNARNCAIDAAAGSLLVWTDDDVLVDTGWLTGYVEASRRWPEAAFFGGTIEPWYESTPPWWVEPNLERLRGILVIRNIDLVERRLHERELPFGANMAVRTMFMGKESFNPALGKMGNVGTVADETDFLGRLKAAGHFGVWVPTARVRHWVPSKRMTRGFVWDYSRDYGRTQFRLDRIAGRPHCSTGTARLMLSVVSLWLRSILERMRGDSAWIKPYMKAAVEWGLYLESQESRVSVSPLKT